MIVDDDANQIPSRTQADSTKSSVKDPSPQQPIPTMKDLTKPSTTPNQTSYHYSDKDLKSENQELTRLRIEFDNFFSNQTAYINLKENNKLIVFNTELSIQEVIEAMIQQDIYCGLIWNTELNKFSGIFTIRDCLIALYISYDKITKLSLKGSHWSNTKQLASLIFQKNDFQLEELDIIMENVNSSGNSEYDEVPETNEEEEGHNSQKQDLNIKPSQNSNSVNINSNFNVSNSNNLANIELIHGESKFSSYKEYFEIFNHVTLNEYYNDLQNDVLFNNKIISVDLDCQLKEAVKLMQRNLIHRIAIEDTKNSMFVGMVTYESIFSYFINNYYNYDMECFHASYKKLNFVTTSLVCCYEDQLIYSCLFKIWEARISMLPILEKPDSTKNGGKAKVLGYLFLKDLVYFMTNGEKFKFSDTIRTFLEELYSDVNEEKPYGRDRISFIQQGDEYSFKDILELIYHSPENKIVIEKNKEPCSLYGMISLSDVFKIIFP
mmetsp:Transcript_342/g.329  ORF Transcript_342/g.329 Transcript_342/m.329 type:complete len:493 (+) Transcript_342:3-1481(+)